MRKVILGVAVSLDGFIEGHNGEYDWCFTDQDYGMKEFHNRIDAVFLGRKSFEVADQAGFDMMKSLSCYVFSNTLKLAPNGTKLVSGDILKAIKEIKSEPGKDIWLFGGAKLTTSFVNHNLIDEYWLSVHPVILGAGKPLFQEINDRRWLNLIEHKAYSSGLVSFRFEPKFGQK
jgi:dihydrofolate reductase